MKDTPIVSESIPSRNVNHVDRGNQVRAEMATYLPLLRLQIKVVAATRGSSGRNLAMHLKNTTACEDCRRNIVDADKLGPNGLKSTGLYAYSLLLGQCAQNDSF